MSLTDDTLQLLQDLIRNGCVNNLTADSGQEERNARTLEQFFEGTDVTVERYEPHPGRVSVAFTLEGTDPSAESLTLLGHTDPLFDGLYEYYRRATLLGHEPA